MHHHQSQKHYVIIISSSSSITRGASYLWLDHYYCFFFFVYSLSLSLSFSLCYFCLVVVVVVIEQKRRNCGADRSEKFGKILSHARCKKKSKLREYKIFHLQY